MTQVLVMCPSCGRPQFAAAQCVACGTDLPEAVKPPVAQGRDQILQAFEPHFEASLGAGKVLKLSERRLEWEDPRKPRRQLELRGISEVRLVRRPVWEALLFLPVALGLMAIPWWGAKVVGGAFVVVILAAAFLQQRFTVLCQRKDAPAERLDLGFGRPGTPVVERIHSVWTSLSQELSRLGTQVR